MPTAESHSGRWEALVLDQSNLAPHDGLLGDGFLTRNGAVLDYGSKRIFLLYARQDSSRGTETTDLGSDQLTALLKKQGYLEVPLTYGQSIKEPHVVATIQERPVRLGIDTGSSSSMLSLAFAERLQMPKFDTAQQLNMFFGATPARYRTRAQAFNPKIGSDFDDRR